MTDKITIIVATADNNAIGANGDLLWHISADLKRFKAITLGHTIIMGRKTWNSLPKGALPGRRNVVITRNPDFKAPGADTFTSISDALNSCNDEEEIFIIGGGHIYRQTFPLASRLLLTKVFATYPQADTFFPAISLDEWQITHAEPPAETSDGLKYQFIDYSKITK